MGTENLIGRCTGHLSRLWLVELKPTLDVLWKSEGKLEFFWNSKVKGNVDVGDMANKGLMNAKISVEHIEQCIPCIIEAIEVQDLSK